MKVFYTKPFVKDYRDLPEQIQQQFDKQLELLLKDFKHEKFFLYLDTFDPHDYCPR